MKPVGLTLAAVAAALLGACGQGGGPANDGGMVVGFSQIGSESGWRTAETNAARKAAETRKVDLRNSDAQQRQENQITASRAFIAQGVEGILRAPVVATGWDQVLKEAKTAKPRETSSGGSPARSPTSTATESWTSSSPPRRIRRSAIAPARSTCTPARAGSFCGSSRAHRDRRSA